MTLSTATASSSSQPESGGRRRSISGALTRRFTRNNSTAEPRSIPSKSASITKRRATIATTSADETGAQVHVRIVPNIENPSRSLIFDIVDRVLSVGSVIRIGRYSERHANLDCMSFKSKVVSRCHCEVWVETDGKVNMGPFNAFPLPNSLASSLLTLRLVVYSRHEVLFWYLFKSYSS